MNDLKLYIIHTTRDDYDEHNPFIVLAKSEGEAKQLVLESGEFKTDKEVRLRTMGLAPWGNGKIKGYMKPEDRPSEITRVEEVKLEPEVVWGVFNPG